MPGGTTGHADTAPAPCGTSGRARRRPDAAAVTGATGLTRHGSEVKSVFDLLGRDENDLTAALAFTLARSPELLRRVAARLLPGAAGPVGLQLEVRDDLGRTDLELTAGGQLAVVEAKRGWLLPDPAQLAAYAPRVRKAGGGVLATLSEASVIWAAHALPPAVAGVPVMHCPGRTCVGTWPRPGPQPGVASGTG